VEQSGRALRLLWPVTAANFDTASYSQLAEGHFLTRNMMIWFWDATGRGKFEINEN